MVVDIRRDVFVLAQSAGVEAIVTTAVGRDSTLAVARWSVGATATALSPTSTFMVVDLAPVGFDDAIAAVRVARSRNPKTVVIGLATLSETLPILMRFAEDVGISDVILLDVEDAIQLIRAHLVDSSKRGARASALRLIQRVTPLPTRSICETVIGNAETCLSVSDVGQVVGRSRWTLDRELSGIGLTASEFIDWCRIILGAALLERSSWPVQRVASSVGFKDVRSFRNAARRLLRCLPENLRQPSSAERAARIFAERLDEARIQPRLSKMRNVPWLLDRKPA